MSAQEALPLSCMIHMVVEVSSTAQDQHHWDCHVPTHLLICLDGSVDAYVHTQVEQSCKCTSMTVVLQLTDQCCKQYIGIHADHTVLPICVKHSESLIQNSDLQTRPACTSLFVR